MNSVFYRTKPIIGLDFSRTGVRVVSVNREKMLVHGYGSVELDPSKISDNLETSRDYLTQKIEALLRENIIGKLDSNRVILGVPTMRTFARTFTIPTAQEAKVKQAVNLEVEQYVPMPLENLYVDHLIISRTAKELTVLMCAVPKKFIDDLLGVLTALGLEVAVIEPSIYAIARLLEATKEGGMPTVIVDLSPGDTDIAIFDGAVRVTGGLNIGGNTLTLDIAKKMDLTIENAHQLKVLSGLNPGPRQAKVSAALRPSLLKIINETKKVMRFYTERFPDVDKLEQILIVGSGSNVPGLGEFFTNELVMPARVASPWQALDFAHIAQPAKHLRARLATAAGLALVDPKEAVK
jgi:type IV pilus assembly protein PilM